MVVTAESMTLMAKRVQNLNSDNKLAKMKIIALELEVIAETAAVHYQLAGEFPKSNPVTMRPSSRSGLMLGLEGPHMWKRKCGH